MSVTENTASNLILDAGVVYLHFGTASEAVLGATAGGNTFSVTREIKEIQVDGIKGKAKGLRRITVENASLEVNLREMSAANLQLALAGSNKADYPDLATKTHDSITSDAGLANADFVDSIALVATVSGSTDPVVILLYNVLADGEFSMALTDKEEAVLKVTFSAHYDPADLTAPIFEIRYPLVS